ncbi:MAG TPA: hypothetical protein VGK32_13910 [Vicinamibacterales bacterium]|jgi:hypothetical protein
MRLALAVIAVCLAAVPAAHAQSDSALAVGVAVSIYDTTSANAKNPVGFGLVARLRRGSGFGATMGLDWFKSEIQTTIGGEQTPVGTVRIRPLMFGVSYARQYAKLSIGGSLVAGYAFNTLRETDRARAAYRDRLDVPDAGFHAANCFAWRPDVSLWYEMGNHIGVLASLSYIGARPTITTTSRLGRHDESVNVGAAMLTFGVVYGIF